MDAAEKAIPRFLAQDVDLRILTVPDGLDPDEYVDQFGGEALLKLAEDAPEAFEYQLRLLLSRYGKTTVDSRQRVLDGMLSLLTLSPGIAGSLKEDLLVGRLPQRLGLSEVDVRRRLKQLRSEHPSASTRRPERKVDKGGPNDSSDDQRMKQLVDSLQRFAGNDEKLECELLQLLFSHAELIHAVRHQVGLDDFRHEALRNLLSIWFDMVEEGNEPNFDRMLARIECVHQKRLAVWVEEQSPHRDSRKRPASSSGSGTETAEQSLRRVVERLKWRHSHDANQVSKSLLVERPAEMEKLTAETLELLKQAARFHQERAAK